MKKSVILIILFAAVALGARQDNRAEALLKEVADKFGSYENFTVHFTYEFYNPGAGLSQETNGKVIMAGNKYYAEYMGVIDIFDGERRYLIVPENEEVHIMKPGDEDWGFTPADLFRLYTDQYDARMDIKQKVNGRLIQYVKLIPREEGETEYILVGIDMTTKHIYKVIVVQKDGSRITVKIRKINVNRPMNEKIFRFDREKYQNYYINEPE
ncbi:MAG: outer membrane lipoprotein carrier protein LolA [Chlorobi bacterium]|nr:outer membrane lipoprotein carrier protein LolA [Chlorobiota bacterium]